MGERTARTPTSGPATSYAYDQAGDLTSVSRPEEGETPKIEDSYAYDGDGLRASQTISGATAHLTWDLAESVPPILDDGTYSFVYGPAGLPVEQTVVMGGVVVEMAVGAYETLSNPAAMLERMRHVSIPGYVSGLDVTAVLAGPALAAAQLQSVDAALRGAARPGGAVVVVC